MGLENSNASQPLESLGHPVKPGQTSSQTNRQEPGDNSRSPDAPFNSSLPSMMKSLTPNAPATSGDSAPQYPSLEAAVEIEQQLAPTLTNLLATKTQDAPDLGLGAPGMAMAVVTTLPSVGSQEQSQLSEAPKNQAAENLSTENLAVVNSISEHLSAETLATEIPATPTTDIAMADDSSEHLPAQALTDEQGPLAGEAIAIHLPESAQTSHSTSSTSTPPTEDMHPDASWDAITKSGSQEDSSAQRQDQLGQAPTDIGTDTVPVLVSDASAPPIKEPQVTQGAESQSMAPSPELEGLAQAPQTELSLSQVEAAWGDETHEGGEGDDRAADDAQVDSTQSDSVQSDDNDFDRVEEGDRAQQVLIKREDNHVAVIFPEEEASANPDITVEFIDSQLWQDLQQRLSGGTTFASNTPVHLYSQNCLLDTRQLQELDEALGRFKLKLVRIITSRRQTAVAAAMSGYSADQTNNLPELLSKEVHSPQNIGLAEPLYLQKNIRSGTEIRHPGSVVIMGDLNPGSSVIADGDILVWGRLRGIAHAGAAGNKTSIVMALKLEAPQLRIAEAVARVDAQSKDAPSPEIAYINGKSIRITSAYGFNRNELG